MQKPDFLCRSDFRCKALPGVPRGRAPWPGLGCPQIYFGKGGGQEQGPQTVEVEHGASASRYNGGSRSHVCFVRNGGVFLEEEAR